tara:strand:- start:215 stop:382 length:168 start_codon:yes stop_codon:yes gene_type:complete
MTERTELERLQKAVVDTEAAYDVSWDDAIETYDAFTKARLDLSNYLKEHGDEHSI